MQTTSECRRPSRWVFLTLLLTLAATPITPAVAVAAPPLAITACAVPCPPPLAAWYDNLWDKIWLKIYTSLNSRTGAIQWGLIGMLIALWIIWWRK